MLTLILLATLSVPPQAPCLPQTVLPVVDDTPVAPAPRVKTCYCSERCVCGCNSGEPCECAGPRMGVASTPQPIYRIGSLPQGFTQPATPTYQQSFAPAICLPGR